MQQHIARPPSKPSMPQGAHLALGRGELDERDALERASLAVSRQAHAIDLAAVCKGGRQLLAHILLLQVAAESLDENRGGVAIATATILLLRACGVGNMPVRYSVTHASYESMRLQQPLFQRVQPVV